MGRNLFDLIKGVTKDKVKWETLTDEEKTLWNNYMISRWFSMEIALTEVMNDFQKYSNGILTSKDYYTLLLDALPKTYFFLKYVKKRKKLDVEQRFIDILANHYQVSKRDILDYLLLLANTDELIGVVQSYGLKEEDVVLFQKQLKTLK